MLQTKNCKSLEKLKISSTTTAIYRSWTAYASEYQTYIITGQSMIGMSKVDIVPGYGIASDISNRVIIDVEICYTVTQILIAIKTSPKGT